MAKKDKFSEKLKEGVSVEEIEKFARKYTNEVFLIVSLILATISSVFSFFTGPSWSLFCAGLLAIIAIALPEQMGKAIKKMFKFQTKAEKTTTIVIGIIRIIFGIFIPFILFAELGLLAGYSFHIIAKEFMPEEQPKETIEHHEPEE